MSEYYYNKIQSGLIDAPEDSPEILEEQAQIWQYMPLVKKMANTYTKWCNCGFEDLCQQGYFILAGLAPKVDWLSDKKKISKFISTSLSGQLKTYIAKYSGVVSLPKWEQDMPTRFALPSVDPDTLLSDEPDVEQKYLKEEEKDAAHAAVALILPSLNEREFYVLFNCLYTDDPIGYREVADQFQTSRTSILRDTKRVLAWLKEAMHEDIKAEVV